jgi:signal peptidase
MKDERGDMAGIFGARAKRRSALRAVDAAALAPDAPPAAGLDAPAPDAGFETVLAAEARVTDGRAVDPAALWAGPRDADDTVELPQSALAAAGLTIEIPVVPQEEKPEAPPAKRRPFRTVYRFHREVLRAAATAYLSAYLSLMVWALLPLAFGWTPSVIVSGSMEPVIHVGDVVFFAKEPVDTLAPGRVILVEDPAGQGGLLSHRLHERKGDGTFITKGDANAGPDSTPVRPSQVRGAARLVIPYVGKMVLWQEENRKQAAVWTAMTGLAILFVRNPKGGDHSPGAAKPEPARRGRRTRSS